MTRKEFISEELLLVVDCVTSGQRRASCFSLKLTVCWLQRWFNGWYWSFRQLLCQKANTACDRFTLKQQLAHRSVRSPQLKDAPGCFAHNDGECVHLAPLKSLTSHPKRERKSAFYFNFSSNWSLASKITEQPTSFFLNRNGLFKNVSHLRRQNWKSSVQNPPARSVAGRTWQSGVIALVRVMLSWRYSSY